MPTRLMPDARPLMRDFLKEQASIKALIGNPARIHGAIPRTPIFPLLIIVGDVAGTEIIREHLDEAVVQFDVYGNIDTDANAPASTDFDDQARLIARTVRAEALTAPSYDHPRGVITDVATLRRPQPLPDTTTNPSRPRYSFDLGITCHPHPL
jgi:hypothetical protein